MQSTCSVPSRQGSHVHAVGSVVIETSPVDPTVAIAADALSATAVALVEASVPDVPPAPPWWTPAPPQAPQSKLIMRTAEGLKKLIARSTSNMCAHHFPLALSYIGRAAAPHCAVMGQFQI
jgi:hypothetical protein